ncbi:LuxR C-terminal-related transcriptional regulator [Planosporangium flavigriseum]|uniref:LuxR C-terminal-related transcriptional regulator n=1 Tax=Planosporangium flavigriseum TaxID=373681 RepID=UPI001EF2B876|nr:LuxR C-terminal-related transcriptional regulator [Planosporangium flavigriseum]
MPLLTSKLTVPVLPNGLVTRPRLVEMLDAGIRGPLTVLSAPAGWGKTALLNAWVRAGGPVQPVTWLTVEADDAGDRFWAYLHSALNTSGATKGADHQSVPAPGIVARDVYLARLANALAGLPAPTVVVLDDFHQVPDPGVPEGLEFLLRHTAGRLRLVIATRMDPALPLHRWRLSGELTEVQARDLAFTVEETAELLARHGVELPDGHLAALRAHTEGWPAGLRLAALAMREHPDPPRFVDQFSGVQPGIAEYLTGEVLADLSAEIRYALLCTSVLERVCGGLMDALTGRSDGARILAELERRNAFTVPIPGQYPWYRYHRLFAELLRAELSRELPEKVPHLHRAAAAWYAGHGLPADALRHALAAGDWRYATALLVDHWPELVLCKGNGALRTLVPPPPPDAAARTDPELALAYAADRLDLGDLGAADAYLRLADDQRPRLAAARRERFTLMAAAFQLARAQLAGDNGKVLSYAARLIALAPVADPAAVEETGEDASLWAIAYAARGAAHLNDGRLAAAADALGAGLAAAELAGLPCAQLLCAGRLALLRALRGELRRAEESARAALALPPCAGRCRLTGSAYAYLALALVRYEWDRLDDAERYLELAAGTGDQAGEPILTAGIAAIRAGVLRARGELAAGYTVLVAARRDLGAKLTGYLGDWLTAAEADLRTCYGDIETARELLIPLLEESRPAAPAVAVALARAYLRDDDPGAAARALPVWAEDQDGTPLPLRLEAGLLAAVTSRLAGETHRASALLERVLQLAEPEGFRRLFTHGEPQLRALLVDQLDAGTAYWSMVSEALKASAAEPPRDDLPPVDLVEPLSDRELTVLRYLQGALSNLEIASDLSLSVNTVKTHVRSIYRKLHAAHRREAVLKARQLRLL